MKPTVQIDRPGPPGKIGHLVSLKPGDKAIPIRVRLTIGRSPSNDLCLDDPHISNTHCLISKIGDHFHIEDLGSRNGVQVNGVKTKECRLREGSQIVLGQSEFVFKFYCPSKISPDLRVSSSNPNWNSQLAMLPNLASTDLPLLITGESGTGKDVIARQIHEMSKRSDGPYVSVNCSALNDSLFESELFGHVRGSFTGAQSNRKGAFESARQGTLFLDEIGDLPLNLQPKLLRALENSEIKPVGSDRVIKTNVRIVSATHKNLKYLSEKKKFREDLYFRIHVLSFDIPPLRKRREDIDGLVYKFCKDYGVFFSTEAIELLKKHQWPGNIRELRNIVARAQALPGAQALTEDHVRFLLGTGASKNLTSPSREFTGSPQRRREIERRIMEQALTIHKGNQRRAADDIGMPRSTFHDKVRTYGIDVYSLLDVEGFEEDSSDPTFI